MPPRKRASTRAPLESAPLPDELVLPLEGGLSARDMRPAVQSGQRVLRGQPLVRGGGPLSTWTRAGLDGAVFPTGIKLAATRRNAIHTVIVNAAECEPYISCDDMLMRSAPREVLAGGVSVTSNGIEHTIRKKERKAMHNIRDILRKKGTAIWSVAPEETVLEAIRRLDEHGVGALLVLNGDELVGLFSERDYTRKVILKGLRSQDTPVGTVMSAPVLTISPDATVQQGLSMMTEQYIRHLPVTDDSGVIGVVSIGDLVKAVIEDQEALIEQLERFIMG